MAADRGAGSFPQTKPLTAPTSSAEISIPKIVLDERKEENTQGLPSSSSGTPAALVSSTITVANSEHSANCPLADGTGLSDSLCRGCDVTSAGIHACHVTSVASHVPTRSSSDVGLPATSMPNLALKQSGGGGVEGSMTGSENHLGVYCSPRTFRRSVDLDINSREETRGQYEWIETLESSSNSLQVLTSSSRVGSALSLNSECTARSIGLLSNDSDSDNDTSISEREKVSEKPAQLRRYMSYPEESPSPEPSARPSRSLGNLMSAHVQASTDSTLPSSASLETGNSDGATTSDSKLETSVTESQELLSGDLTEKAHSGRKGGGVALRKPKKVEARDVCFSLDDTSSSGTNRSCHMLCYKCDANSSMREGRIRQWLQDMDKHGYSNG